MSLATDTTQKDKKYVITFIIAALLFFVLFSINVLRYIYLGIFDGPPSFFYLMIIAIIYGRTKPTYDVAVERRAFRIVKHGIFGKTTVYEIPYRDIMGIFHYKPELVRSVKFRYTYRLNSALDSRTMWTLAWRRQEDNGKENNVRIYFKASKEVIRALSDKLPGKVDVPENLVNLEILAREGSVTYSPQDLKKAEELILEQEERMQNKKLKKQHKLAHNEAETPAPAQASTDIAQAAPTVEAVVEDKEASAKE